MKLISIQVKNYKCIEDSGRFSLRNLTCLAGKNEAGKTALLQALRRLNPVESSERKFNDLMEYPRARRHEVSQPGKDEVLVTEWQLSEDDISAVEQILGPGCTGAPHRDYYSKVQCQLSHMVRHH